MNELTSFEYRGFFEAHISIAPISSQQSIIFQDFCEKENIKSIQIELSRGTHSIQPMSCSLHQGTLTSVKKEVQLLAQKLKQTGFEVVRSKIEASPKNQDIPIQPEEIALHSDTNYFEHHWKILLEQLQDLNTLTQLCERYGVHLSKNAFKQQTEVLVERFITIRLYQKSLLETKQLCEEFTQQLNNLHIPIVKQITEYCVFDSFVELDEKWLSDMVICSYCPNPCTNDNHITP